MSAPDHRWSHERWAKPPTPFLALDLETLDRNITKAQQFCDDNGLRLRPHVKTHKVREVAERQVAAGAHGLTVASLGEAELFADAGFVDLFLATSVYATVSSSRRIAALADRAQLSLAVDSMAGVAALRGQGLQREPGLRLRVEVDCGLRRTGLPPAEAASVAELAVEHGFEVSGFFTYPGHSYRAGAAETAARDERDGLVRARDELAQRGLPCEVLSGGSTPTFAATEVGGPNEVRPGVYAFNDGQQLALGTAELDEVALVVIATVISIPERGRMVLDSGSKTLAADRPSFVDGHGLVLGMPSTRIVRIWEHHAVLDTLSEDPRQLPHVGDRVAVVPNHVCTAINLARELHVGFADHIETWPVFARAANS